MPSRFTSILFLLLIFGLPLGQAGWELSRDEPVQALDVLGNLREDRLRVFEDDLREASFVHRVVSPFYQWVLLYAGKGNEKAVLGNDDWLYYGDDLDLITSRGFLQGRERSPVDAVVEFRDQLAQRGVELLFVPVPAKPMVEPGHLSRWTAGLDRAENTDTGAFLQELEQRDVHVVDLMPVFDRARVAGKSLYLARDTHWTPSTMILAAGEIAARGRELIEARGESLASTLDLETRAHPVESAGDLLGMLRLPDPAAPFDPMGFEIEQVVDAASGAFVTFSTEAEVLIMGDSFTGVFSDPRFELGEHGGLGEHLAREFGSPVDVIQIAGGAARSVRESLARRGEGVADKKLVIWQVSQRELIETDGRWGPVDLFPAGEAGGTEAADDPVEGATEPLTVLAEVVKVSRVPEGFEYDFCLAFYEYRVLEVTSGELPDGPIWVAHVAVDEFDPQPGGTYAVGERHRLVLEDIRHHHDLESTSFVDDTNAGRRIWFPTELASGD